VLIPLLSSLFTDNYLAMHDSNTIVKFTGSDNNETAYSDLEVWCQDNNH
jgi:hypothetical protein